MVNRKKYSSYTVSVGVLIQLVQYLSILKVDINKLLNSVGLSPSILTSPDERVPVEKYIQIEDEAANLTNDPWFGLHMGQFTEVGNWSILGYMMMNCKTLGEAFEKYAKYSSILGNVIKGDILRSSNTATITLTVPNDAPVISRHCYEGYLASLICLARTLSVKNVNSIEVGLTFSKIDPAQEYFKVFGSPVLFNQKQNYMVIDLELLNTPVVLPNANLLQYFENYAREVLFEIEEPNGITYKVKKLILSLMDNEKLTIDIIAKEMSISVRTLQVHLKKEGTEFSKLLRETKEHLAKKYLRENYTVEDITYLLGFSEPAVFRKAFKRWVGVTPKEYRESKALQ